MIWGGSCRCLLSVVLETKEDERRGLGGALTHFDW